MLKSLQKKIILNACDTYLNAVYEYLLENALVDEDFMSFPEFNEAINNKMCVKVKKMKGGV